MSLTIDQYVTSPPKRRHAYRACHAHDEWVQLDRWERELAYDVGRRMRAESLGLGLKEKHDWMGLKGFQGDRDQMIGAQIEREVAKLLDIYWPSAVNIGSRADFERHNIEARLIGVDHYGLRVKPNEEDSRFVVGISMPRGTEENAHRCPGWILAADGKREEWSIDPHDRPPIFAVPQEYLRPLSELRTLIGRPS